MLTIEGIYDGEVVHLLSKKSLPPNTLVKVLVEDESEENWEPPKLGEDYSFLKIVMRAKLQGHHDFSENIHDYLKTDKLSNHQIYRASRKFPLIARMHDK